MASLSSTLGFISPKPSFSKPFSRPKLHIFSLTFSSPISFQPISHNPPPSSPLPQPVKAQQQAPQSPSPSLSLPPNLERIVALFQSVPDPKSKYQQLLHYGTQLPPYPPQYRTDDYRVRGCVSQVWVRAYPDPTDPSKVRFDADSDSSLTKGLAALLVLGLSGEPPSVVTAVSPDFVQLLGLKQGLTPSRNNGFLNMMKLMQKKAAEVGGLRSSSSSGGQDEILVEETADLGGNNGGSERNLDLNGQNRILVEEDGSLGKEIDRFEQNSSGSLSLQDAILEEETADLGKTNGGFERSSGLDGQNGSLVEEDESLGAEIDGFDQNLATENEIEVSVSGGRRERIRERLERELMPVELEVADVSHLHAGHAGIRGNNSGETHFNLRVVSEKFEGKSMVKRHRLVYDLLQEELESGLHALSIVAKAPSEI